jgi:hypothetical protein
VTGLWRGPGSASLAAAPAFVFASALSVLADRLAERVLREHLADLVESSGAYLVGIRSQ